MATKGTKKTSTKKTTAKRASTKRVSAKKASTKRVSAKKASTKKASTKKRATTRRSTQRATKRVDPTPVAPKKQAVAAAPPSPILTVPKPLSRIFAPQASEPTPAAPAPPAPPAEAPSAEKRGEVIAFDAARFAADAWVSVTYEGEDMFVHPQAGVFVRGTSTRLEGRLAVELADHGSFRLRKAG